MRSVCRVEGCDRPAKARGCCHTHYSRWYRGQPVEVDPAWLIDGLGVCECPISWPAPKCCTTCGFPCVHRMAPTIRDRALTKMPKLAEQVIAGRSERGAA